MSTRIALASAAILTAIGAHGALAGTTIADPPAIVAGGPLAELEPSIFGQSSGWSPLERGIAGLVLLALVVGALLEIGRDIRKMDEQGVER